MSDTNHMNTSLISVFSGFIFTQDTAVSRGTACSAKHARKSFNHYLYSRHFSETNFVSAEKTRLDRLTVPGLCTVV
jgi:hypothetical protein